ncbi:MAG: type II secretion system secretin GspD [Planctomycetota bacterium]|nr:type II secretion system secretin GspD [Planctomycetota bacterium]
MTMSVPQHGAKRETALRLAGVAGVFAMAVAAALTAIGRAGAQDVLPVAPPATTLPASAAASQPATRRIVPGEPLRLNFQDASLRSVLDYLSEAAGLMIVEEAKIEGRITVISRQSVTIEEAVGLLDTVLRQKGLAAIRNGRVMRIVTIEQAKKDLLPVGLGSDPTKIPASDRMITQVVPIRNADAVKLKADLASLVPSTADMASNASSNALIITGTEAMVKRLVEIIRAIDVSMVDSSLVKVIQLQYANATATAKLIMDVFKEDQTAQQGGPFGGGGGGRRFMMQAIGAAMGGPGGPGGAQEQGRKPPKVVATADERTNTLVVSAAPEVMKVIEDIVKELEKNGDQQQAVFVYRVRNGQAANMAVLLNNIFGTGATGSTGVSGAGSTGRQQGRTTGSAGSTFGGFGGSTGSGGSGTFSNLRGSNSSSSSGTRGGLSRTSSSGTTGTTGRTGALGYTGGTARPGSTGGGASDLAGQVYVVPDEDTNSLLVTTGTKNFDRVRSVIADLDRAVPQVLIKVLIAEVTHDNSLDLGVELSGMNMRASGYGTKVGTDFSVAAQTTGFTFKLNEQNVTAALRAIANKSTLDVLSRPYVLTADNQLATIMVGQEVPFITRSQITDNGQTINTVEYRDIGIIVDVTPHINPQGVVTLDVAPEISAFSGESVQISETVKSPVIAKRFAQSRVAIQDGQTIVIGGLMEDRNTTSVDKVPGLGDMPSPWGDFWQRKTTKKTKTELLIFLTPHVAEHPGELKEMSRDEEGGMKVTPDAVEPGAFQDHMRGMQRGAIQRPASRPFQPEALGNEYRIPPQ